MKIRKCFVSNSSTTSFCIYGTTVKRGTDAYERASSGNLEHNGLECYHPSFYDDYVVGISWCKVKDNQTGKQFKEDVEALIERLIGEKLPCNTYEEAWHD
jgi:hypothetical protein